MELLNVGFAPWLLLAALPVAIHLLTRRAVRDVALPTFRFLREAVARQSRIFRVRHLLLLALRCLFVALLVAAFMKPTRTAPLASGGGARTVVIVLDVSLSMGYRAGGVSTLDRASAQAGKILEGLAPADRANVLLAGAAPVSVQPKPTTDRALLHQALASAKPTPERADVQAALAAAADQLGRAETKARELYLVSDYQRSSWASTQLGAIPAATRVVFVGAGDADRPNAAVTEIRLQPSTPRLGDDVTVLAEVWSGDVAARTIPVTLQVEGSAARMASVTVPPYSTAAASFPVTFSRPGRYTLTASTPRDNLPDAGARWRVVDLQHALTVLLITDENVAAAPSGSYYLSRALCPVPDEPGGIRVIAKRAQDLREADFAAADGAIFYRTTTMPADRMPLLARWVKAGGALLAFATDEASIGQLAALNRLGGQGEGLPYLPTRAMDVGRQGKGYVTLAEARYESRLLRVFKDPAAADLGHIRFRRFFLTTEPDSRAEVLLKYEDGTPAAARRAYGAGTVLLCNFTASPRDSDLPKQEVFPPLMHEFLKGVVAREGDRREAHPGEAVSTVVPARATSVSVTGPDGVARAAAFDPATGGVVLDAADAAGVYTVKADGREVARMAVNIHPDETDLRTIDPRELQSAHDRRPVYLAGEGNGAGSVQDLTRGRPLWPWVVLAAGAVLLAEQWLAGTKRGGR